MADSLVAQSALGSESSSYAGPAGEVMRLLDQIAATRRENAVFEILADEIANKMQQRLNAHRERVLALRTATYHALGRCLRDHRWSKRQYQDFVELMVNFNNVLIAEHGINLFEDFLNYSGLSREDFEEWSPDASDKRGEENESNHASGEIPNSDDFANAEEPQKKSNRKKPGDNSQGKPSSHRDEPLKRKSQDTGLFGDIRALYLMLARALHPDKESDEQRRTEKTAWMQKVTQAYASKNLGDLLDILMRNPLNAIGPYLAEAPLKTLKGFSKRLKRELTELRKTKDRYAEQFNPIVLSMIRKGAFSEQAYKRWESDLNQGIKIHKGRNETYSNLDGVKYLLKVSREHDWRLLF